MGSEMCIRDRWQGGSSEGRKKSFSSDIFSFPADFSQIGQLQLVLILRLSGLTEMEGPRLVERAGSLALSD